MSKDQISASNDFEGTDDSTYEVFFRMSRQINFLLAKIRNLEDALAERAGNEGRLRERELILVARIEALESARSRKVALAVRKMIGR